MSCVRIRDLDRCEAAGNYVEMHSGTRAFTVRCTLTQLCAELGSSGFLRISRTNMVNIERLLEIQPTSSGDYDVVLHGGWSGRLTKGYRNDFMERFVLL
jgi:two-component system, LytTR family, response regulator